LNSSAFATRIAGAPCAEYHLVVVADETSKGVVDAAELAHELACLRVVAQETSGPLGLLIANLGFALEEISALRVELSPEAVGTGDDLTAQVGRAQSALSAVEDALREARKGADDLRQLARELACHAPEGRRAAQVSKGNRAEATASASSRPPETLLRGRVLVVDDEPMIVRAIQRLLEGEHEVCLSTDPIEVVEQVRAGRRFDVILCDLMMPTMSGIDVYDAIRRIDADQARRMVFMTGGAFTPRVVEFLGTTENARLEKPLERTTLRAAIRARLSS
jgi:CheY-like chemotaxis protein